jgi:predicted MFS family arabinose efflux permease
MNATLLTEAWPERSRAIFVGFLSMGFPIGIISSGTINFMVQDWRIGFLSGILPLVIGLVSFRWLRESEKWKVARLQQKPQANRKLVHDQRSNLVNGSIIFGCMLIGLWAVFSWLPTWVQSLLSHTEGSRERGLSMMLLGAGGLTGGFFSGWVSRALGTRRAMLFVFAGSFMVSIVLFKMNNVFSGVILAEIALLAVMFGISQGLLGYYIPLLFPVAIRGTATGFCFNIGRIVTTAAVLMIGWLVIALGGYGSSLFTFSFVFLIGFIVLYYSKNIVK